MTIPDESECLALLRKYGTPDHIVMHSLKVWEVAAVLTNALLKRDHPLNVALVRASALLHDIGKYPCILDGEGYHDLRGERILQDEGMPAVARIVVQHVVLRGSPDDPIREEHVVYYADKRVVHDQVVSLEDRFLYLERTYVHSVDHGQWLCDMKKATQRLERTIFSLLDFEPGDVVALLG